MVRFQVLWVAHRSRDSDSPSLAQKRRRRANLSPHLRGAVAHSPRSPPPFQQGASPRVEVIVACPSSSGEATSVCVPSTRGRLCHVWGRSASCRVPLFGWLDSLQKSAPETRESRRLLQDCFPCDGSVHSVLRPPRQPVPTTTTPHTILTWKRKVRC